MLSCICSVAGHKWRQNVVTTKKKWHTRREPSVSLMFLPHFDLGSCDLLLLDARQRGIYLFYIIKKQTTTDKVFQFQNLWTCLASRPLQPFFTLSDKKEPFDPIYCPYKMKQFHWLLCAAKNCDWYRQITPLYTGTCQTFIELRFWWNEKSL